MTDNEYEKRYQAKRSKADEMAGKLATEADERSKDIPTDHGQRYAFKLGVRQSQIDDLVWRIVQLEEQVADLKAMREAPDLRNPNGPESQDWSWVTPEDISEALEAEVRSMGVSSILESDAVRVALTRYWLAEVLMNISGVGDDYCAKCGRKLVNVPSLEDIEKDPDADAECPAGCSEPWQTDTAKQ